MIYNERCTIVANQDGSIKTAFVDQMGVDSEGRHYGAGQATIGSDELTQFLGSAHNADLKTIARLKAEHNATIDNLQTELTESQLMHTQAASRLSELQGDYDAMQTRLNALLNPAIPAGTPGQTKSVTFSFDETAWPGIVAALSDPANTETPTETQATNAVFAFITEAYKANAAKIALEPVQRRVQASIDARAEAVLATASVVVKAG